MHTLLVQIQRSLSSLKGNSLETTPLYIGHIIGSKVLRMRVVLPLAKGHLSNKDIIFWQKGCPY